MSHAHQFYIDGRWVEPHLPCVFPVVNPATEEAFASISLGSTADVDDAVDAAVRAFASFSNTTSSERLDLLRRILHEFEKRREELAVTLSRELGVPLTYSRDLQVASGEAHLHKHIEVLERYVFEEQSGTTRVAREPIGVVGLITPWNWPINQIVCKVAPAIAAGCCMILKPSEITPLCALIFAEILDAAGVPPGVFNLINGDGPSVGQAISSHPRIDMVSFTGSTRAGIQVAKSAADTVKRVCQELGGKSPNIILEDADVFEAARGGAEMCFSNSGQTCDAPTRMLVPRGSMHLAIQGAQAAVKATIVGDPESPASLLGPVVSQVQFEKIQALINIGIRENAILVAGGLGRPEGLEQGYYVRPTVFANVDPKMIIAREEIFGPVLSIIPYDDVEEAIRIANDSEYGLAAYVQSTDMQAARRVAARLRAGTIHLNYPDWDLDAPFGGYKQSGNGREYGDHGISEFQELKSIVGYGTD